MDLPQVQRKMYDEKLVAPMRRELTELGVEELRTAEEVDSKVKDAKGTAVDVVNSVCGCAARMALLEAATARQNTAGPDERRVGKGGE